MTIRHKDGIPRVGRLLGQLYSYWQRETYGRLQERGFHDIRPSHSPVFRLIRPAGSRAVDLAAAAGLTKQSIAYLITDLTKGGYLETVPDPQDGRARLIRLTTRGLEAEDAIRCASVEVEQQFADELGEETFAAVRRHLTAMADHAGLGVVVKERKAEAFRKL